MFLFHYSCFGSEDSDNRLEFFPLHERPANEALGTLFVNSTNGLKSIV